MFNIFKPKHISPEPPSSPVSEPEIHVSIGEPIIADQSGVMSVREVEPTSSERAALAQEFAPTSSEIGQFVDAMNPAVDVETEIPRGYVAGNSSVSVPGAPSSSTPIESGIHSTAVDVEERGPITLESGFPAFEIPNSERSGASSELVSDVHVTEAPSESASPVEAESTPSEREPESAPVSTMTQPKEIRLTKNDITEAELDEGWDDRSKPPYTPSVMEPDEDEYGRLIEKPTVQADQAPTSQENERAA